MTEKLGNFIANYGFTEESPQRTRLPDPSMATLGNLALRRVMPPDRPNSSPLTGLYRLLTSRAAHLIVGLVAVLGILFSGYDATRTRPSDGTVWLLGLPDLEVLALTPRHAGAPTPLLPGDQILGIGNRIVNSPQQAAQELKKQQPGTSVPYLIERGDKQLQVMVPLASTRVKLSDYAVNLTLTLVYLVIGFAVYLRSRNERPAGLFFIMCLLFGLYFMTNLEQASYFLGAIITQNIGALARFMLPAVFMHFFVVFPRKKMILTRHPFLTPLLYILPMMFYLRFSLDQFLGAEGAKIHATSWMILGIYYVLGLGALLHGYFSYRDPMMRERVRILTIGTLAAVIPFLIFKIGMEDLNFHSDLARFGIIPLAAIPISFGYCVTRYRVLQIDLLVKKSLMYALLTGTTWTAYLLGTWWFGGKALALFSGTSPLTAAGVTLALAALLWPARSQIQGFLDNRFYHSRDNMAQLIEEFSKEIPRLIQREALSKWVGTRLCDVLQLHEMAIYLADGDADETDFIRLGQINNPAFKTLPSLAITGDNDNPLPELEQAPTSYPQSLQLRALCHILETRGEPFWADVSDLDHLAGRQAITREQAELGARLKEQQFLNRHGIQLLVPMVAQGRLIGIIALGHRPGGEDYQVHELQLMTIVAGQMALQVENSRLYEEEIAKQLMEEEMAKARLIQSRLLPTKLPRLDGVEIEAINISSKQVSGDYYDVIERPDGKLALVIADVSGKGMGASILASNIQAAMRALSNTAEAPGIMLERLNKQVHASTDPMHFATLFLGVFDPVTKHLLYSSGGHNAPVVVRNDGNIILLEEGGLPLGAFDFGSYDEGETTLEIGDLLFFYTDGVTETKGPDGDEDFGEDRLNSLLKKNRTQKVTDIFETIYQGLELFSGSTEADDDITMLALKITKSDREIAACAKSVINATK